MSTRHHPSAEILAAYAAGTHESGFGLVVGAHVEMCPDCRAQVGAFEAASGAALSELPETELGADALTRALARLAEPAPQHASEDARPLLERLPLKAKRWVAPGVWVAAVDTPHAAENRVYVLSVAKGMVSARHEHSGAEYCTVLKGAYRDEIGTFAAGDFAAAEGDLNHQPIVEGDEACICLFATEGRLKPQGWIGRLAFALADV
ncbi:MAG: ChrR family anti-sigma-E factor [Vitreimonas sp.]